MEYQILVAFHSRFGVTSLPEVVRIEIGMMSDKVSLVWQIFDTFWKTFKICMLGVKSWYYRLITCLSWSRFPKILATITWASLAPALSSIIPRSDLFFPQPCFQIKQCNINAKGNFWSQRMYLWKHCKMGVCFWCHKGPNCRQHQDESGIRLCIKYHSLLNPIQGLSLKSFVLGL